MSWVYIITNNVNDKLYIGLIDHDDPRTRWEEHLHDYCHQDKGLYRAMCKHEEEHFCFDDDAGSFVGNHAPTYEELS